MVTPEPISEVSEMSKQFLKVFSWVYENQNVTYIPTTFSLVNHQNFTVQLLTEFYSEPKTIMDYAVFSCSVENGTWLPSGETLSFILHLTTFANQYNFTGEYYLRVYGEPL